MKIQSFEFNLFGEQTYLIWNESSKEGVIVDPGMSNDVENTKITEFISNNEIKLKYILYTHLHIDHTFGYLIVRVLLAPYLRVSQLMRVQPSRITTVAFLSTIMQM